MADPQRRLWEEIASSFSATRQHPWPHVTAFLDALPAHALVLDLMTGNGRHLRPGHVGLDWSLTLVREAARAHPASHVVCGDARHLPLPTHGFDAVLFCAGLASIPAAADRVAALTEVARVLRPGGVTQVTVWSATAPRFAGGPPGPRDVEVPWKASGKAVARPYHLYTLESLSADLSAAGLACERMDVVGENLVAWARA
ncbi:MAG: class I SAM-dependent methyltransferase [Thermoplasmatota archaeon]